MNRVLIGHNRYATTGKITRRNAHPFEFDTLVGVHNGTLTNKHNLTDSSRFEVDSEALYHNIEKHGVEDALGKTKGAWALVWWDKKRESLNVLRNTERTLFYTYTEDKETIFWASEMWMLTVALSRNEIKYGKVESFETDKHYEFPFNFATDKLEQPVINNIFGMKDDPLPKKAITAQCRGHVGTGLIDDKYLGITSTFKIGLASRDEDGADYIEVVDQSDGSKVVRLYPHKQDYLKNKQDYCFNGKIVGMRRSKHGFLFYKAALNGPLYQPKKAAIISLPQQKKNVRDKRGNIISEADLNRYYHTCGLCNSPIDHNDEGHLYLEIEHGAICKQCVDLPAVKIFTN